MQMLWSLELERTITGHWGMVVWIFSFRILVVTQDFSVLLLVLLSFFLREKHETLDNLVIHSLSTLKADDTAQNDCE